MAFTSTSPDLVEADFNAQEEDAFLFHAASTPPPGPVAVTPCTLLDTRRPADRPALRSNVRRSVKATGTCGVPAAANGGGERDRAPGHGPGEPPALPGRLDGLRRRPAFRQESTRSASCTVPVGPGGAISILPYVAGNGTVQATVEVDAYNPQGAPI